MLSALLAHHPSGNGPSLLEPLWLVVLVGVSVSVMLALGVFLWIKDGFSDDANRKRAPETSQDDSAAHAPTPGDVERPA